jgi:antigen flippase
LTVSETRTNSYRDILRSSSIMGGAQGLNYLVGMVRVKIIAVLLGPAGIGLVGLYQSALGLLGAVSGLGIGSSGVREVAQAHAQNDPVLVARTVLVLRRACWATGLLGWGLAAALAMPLSRWAFGDTDHAVAIAVLGVTLLLGAISGGQTALLQGVRRIGDLARIQVVAMLLNTLVTIALYAWLRERGIVPVIVATAFVSLCISWWFSRRVALQPVVLPWGQTWHDARRLAGLGLAFMWSGLLGAGIDMATRSVITRSYGLEAAGYYQAAWALSGMFGGFILSAMGTDFYPRLATVIHDRETAVRTVNEQTEIGILLALPGILGTLAFAPWVLVLFYSEKFRPSAELLPFLVLGVFGRVVSWPMGFIQLAKGASRWFAATETVFVALWFGLVLWLVPTVGAIGAAYAFVITYVLYALGMLWVGRALIGFRWSSTVKRLLALSGGLVGLAFGLPFVTQGWVTITGGAVLTLMGAAFSLLGLERRLGSESWLARALARLPGGRWLTVHFSIFI